MYLNEQEFQPLAMDFLCYSDSPLNPSRETSKIQLYSLLHAKAADESNPKKFHSVALFLSID